MRCADVPIASEGIVRVRRGRRQRFLLPRAEAGQRVAKILSPVKRICRSSGISPPPQDGLASAAAHPVAKLQLPRFATSARYRTVLPL
jgi:hypothetical protein